MGMRLVVSLTAVCTLAAGCGAEEERRGVVGTPDPRHAREVADDPYALTCGDIAGQHEHPDGEKLVIGVEFALAREPALEKRVAERRELVGGAPRGSAEAARRRLIR